MIHEPSPLSQALGLAAFAGLVLTLWVLAAVAIAAARHYEQRQQHRTRARTRHMEGPSRLDRLDGIGRNLPPAERDQTLQVIDNMRRRVPLHWDGGQR